jgi:hypothetical protein
MEVFLILEGKAMMIVENYSSITTKSIPLYSTRFLLKHVNKEVLQLNLHQHL